MNDVPLGWAGRVMQWLAFATRLVLVNVLFVAGTLAGLMVFGLFPAAVAATTVLGRLRLGGTDADSQGGHVVRDFVTVYRSQFWHTNRVGSIFWLAGVVLYLNVLTAGPATASAGADGTLLVHAVLLVLAALAGLATLAAAATSVALCSRYRDSVTSVWRTALVLPLVSPLMSLSLLATLTAAVVVFSAVPVLVPLVGVSLPLLLSGWLVGRRLAAFEAAETVPAAGQTEPAQAITPAAA
jgi:uncharacterized membrane protein YesL